MDLRWHCAPQRHRQHRYPRGRSLHPGRYRFHLRHDAEQQSDRVGCVEQHAGVRIPVCVEQCLADADGQHADRRRACATGRRRHGLCVLATQHLRGVRALSNSGQDVLVHARGAGHCNPRRGCALVRQQPLLATGLQRRVGASLPHVGDLWADRRCFRSSTVKRTTISSLS